MGRAWAPQRGWSWQISLAWNFLLFSETVPHGYLLLMTPSHSTAVVHVRRGSKQQSLPGTVFLVKKKAFVHKINYLYILTSPLESKVYADSETGLKKSHTIIEGHKFSDSNCAGEMAIQVCKSVWGKLPKFEQVSKKSTRIDPSDVATLSFR